ncbi:MAG: hypothetical protein U0R76_04380 [Candidatus Nanopelagicales bacterium]
MTTSTLRGAALLPIAAAAALLLTACGNVVAGSGSGSGSDLPVLRIGARPAAAADAGPSAPDDPYPLVGTLPTGPATAPVHRYGTAPVPDATVTGIAAALGLSGSTVRHEHGVVLTSRGGELRVRDGGAWSFSRTSVLCPGVQVDVDHADLQGLATSCASSGPGGPGSPAAPAPADAKAAAAALLAAVGDSALPARVETYGSTALVTVGATVGGARTTAVSTSVTVDADGVASAYGVVGEPAEGPAYPLISAAQALDVLRAMPRPAMEIYCPKGSSCPVQGPQRITGADLGLVSAYDGDEQVLVPAWFFSVDGSTDPVTVVAVADRYLADPEPVGGTGSGGGSVGGSSGSGGSAIPPGEPASPEPAQPAPSASDLPLPVSPGYRVSSYSVSSDGRELTLRTEGGVCTDYAGAVDETATTVTATVTGTPSGGAGQVCPAIAKAVEVTVALQTPLGDRTVVDSRTGNPVPRT